MKRRIFALLSVLIFCKLCLQAQVLYDQAFRNAAEEGLAFTYNLEFEEAEDVFSKMEKQWPEYPGPHFLLGINRWWQSYISTTTVYHAYIENQLREAIKLNGNLKKREAYGLEYTFFQYMSYAFLTRLFILKKEWVKAANSGRKALPFLSDGLKYSSESPEFFFSAGIYHYYAESYPRDHYYIRPFTVFFPAGDLKLGLEELEYAAGTPNFTRTESIYYLGDIYLEEEKNYQKALEFKKKLAEMYPQNTWFAADFARALVYAEKPQAAIEVLNPLVAKFEGIKNSQTEHITSENSNYTSQLMMRVYHYMGRAYYSQYKNYDTALDFFEKSLKMASIANISDDRHLPGSYYWIGRCHDEQSDHIKAKTAYQKAISLNENQEVKSQAQACLKGNCLE